MPAVWDGVGGGLSDAILVLIDAGLMQKCSNYICPDKLTIIPICCYF